MLCPVVICSVRTLFAACANQSRRNNGRKSQHEIGTVYRKCPQTVSSHLLHTAPYHPLLILLPRCCASTSSISCSRRVDLSKPHPCLAGNNKKSEKNTTKKTWNHGEKSHYSKFFNMTLAHHLFIGSASLELLILPLLWETLLAPLYCAFSLILYFLCYSSSFSLSPMFIRSWYHNFLAYFSFSFPVSTGCSRFHHSTSIPILL